MVPAAGATLAGAELSGAELTGTGAFGMLGVPGAITAAGAGCAGLLGAGGGAGIGGLTAAGADTLLAAALMGEIVAFATTVPGGVAFVAVGPIGGRNGKDGEVLPPNPSGGVSGARNGCPLCGLGAGVETCAAGGSIAGLALSMIGPTAAGVIDGAGASAIEGIAVCKIGVVTFSGALSAAAPLGAGLTTCASGKALLEV